MSDVRYIDSYGSYGSYGLMSQLIAKLYRNTYLVKHGHYTAVGGAGGVLVLWRSYEVSWVEKIIILRLDCNFSDISLNMTAQHSFTFRG